MKLFTSPNNRVFRLYGLMSLCLLGVVLLADLNAEHILLLSLKYPGIDKIGHFFMHMVLVTWLYGVGRFVRPQANAYRCLLLALGLSLTLGVIDEFHQLLVDGRDFDLHDVLANVCGALSATIVITVRNSGRRLLVLLLVVPLLGLYALVAYSQSSSLYYNAGLLYIKQKNYTAARQAFLSAIAHGETQPGLFNELAWLELENLQLDPAIALEHTSRAIAAKPGNADIQDTHGWALFMNKRYDQALAYLRSSYKSKAEGYCINYHLGAVYHALNMDRQAIKHLLAQIEVNDKDRFAEKSRRLLRLIRQSS